MQIDRVGRSKYRGTAKLVDMQISIPRKSKYRAPWNPETAVAQWTVHGKDRGNSYTYTIKMSLEELLACIEAGITEVCDDRSMRAVGVGALATLRELLSGTSNSEQPGSVSGPQIKLSSLARKISIKK